VTNEDNVFNLLIIGTMKHQSRILNATRGQRELVSKLLLLYADRHEEVETLPFGSVGVILGCKHTRTGDTLVMAASDTADSNLPNIVPPPPVMSTSVIPHAHMDLVPVQDALQSLARTDPSVRIELNEGQILVHGLGSLHLEIVESRLRNEWGVNFEFGKRSVGYREGVGSKPVESIGRWTTEIAGKSIWVAVDLEVRSLAGDEKGDPLWDGNVVVDNKDKPVPPPDSFADQTNELANVSRGISSALSSSPHTNLAMSGVHITFKGFVYPRKLVPSSVLAGASAFILRDSFKQAGMGPLMEPYIRLKITVNEETLGKVVKDLTEHGGEVQDLTSSSGGASEGEQDIEPYPTDGVYVPPEVLSPSASTLKGGSSASLRRVVHAIAPLSQMLDYSNRLRAMSGGHGLFEMENAGFGQVSETRKLEILKELGRA
jgi:elongation factor G